MKEQMNFPTSRESGAPLDGETQIDLHAGNPDLISYEDLVARRRRAEFERQALGTTPERRPLLPHEQLGALNTRVLAVRRHRLSQDDYDQAA